MQTYANYLQLGKARLSRSGLVANGVTLHLRDRVDFNRFLLGTQVHIAEALDLILGQCNHAFKCLDGEIKLVASNCAVPAHTSFVAASLRCLAGVDDIDALNEVIAWCVALDVAARLICLSPETQRALLPAAYIANTAWRAAWVTPETMATYDRHMAASQALPLHMQADRPLTTIAPCQLVSTLCLPWIGPILREFPDRPTLAHMVNAASVADFHCSSDGAIKLNVGSHWIHWYQLEMELAREAALLSASRAEGSIGVGPIACRFQSHVGPGGVASYTCRPYPRAQSSVAALASTLGLRS
ncbi:MULTISPECIES: hypothetical protein [Achromobacter]|uniref:hypothetical protein n=1 Tax=Achromobacter TaxID=222 RepID=UPI0023F67C77|nr:hypothetical protein [Achromobacter anxifer]MDF8363351.1 hypothetical protein [Achromobacter anxifer]